ncbi:MAG TPA: DUF4168 domain-containing protein [Gammaproteobacteria bacterium]|nr:DUF4168 domain-containing protein [Gammaproteobacteria bacterium]
MRNHRILRLAVLPAGLALAALAFASPSSSSSQSQAASSTDLSPMPPTRQISDTTLIKFGNAVLAVRGVHREYQPKINAASGSEKDQLQQEEKQAAGAAITPYMPVSQFMQIKSQVRHDPTLRARLKKLVKEHRENTAPPPSGSAPAPVSDATLADFLRASAALDKVRAQYETKIKAAPDNQTKLSLRKEEKQAAGAAITPYMPVSEYKQVFSQVRHDPQLKARADAMLKEAKKNHHSTTPASASTG